MCKHFPTHYFTVVTIHMVDHWAKEEKMFHVCVFSNETHLAAEKGRTMNAWDLENLKPGSKSQLRDK